MRSWNTRRRSLKSTEITWMPEDIALAPDWLQDEILRAPEELKQWLASQRPLSDNGRAPKECRQGKRGRRRKE